MARHQHIKRRTLVLFALALFAGTALAATKTTTTTDDTTTTPATTTDDSKTTTAAATTTDATTTGDTTTTTDGTTTTDTSMPNLDSTSTTSTSTASDSGTSTGMPTLSDSAAATYTHSPIVVPDTSNAPYMHESDLPRGTVFIVVAAILGAFGAGVLLWRAIIGCLLHRSVKKAALAQHMANDKTNVFGPSGRPPTGLYKYSDRDSTGDLGGLNSRHGTRKTHSRAYTMATDPSASNLFFSPTAVGAGAGGNNGHNRSSSFLPSGFYAAGQAATQGGQRGRSSSNHSHSISLTDLRPSSSGQGGQPDSHSPDVSPGRAPPPPRTHDMARQNLSTSTLNLPGGRAPSTYLDDLLDDQPGPWNQSR